MKVKFETRVIDVKNESQITLILPRHTEIFDLAKEHGVYGNSFQLCYNFDADSVGYENFVLRLVKENDVIEDKHKLRYLGKYSPKFQSSFVFVYLQVSP
jgi:hypothetical protein